MAVDPYAHLKDNAWCELAEIDRRLARGEIEEGEWHAAVAALLVPAYLGAETPWGQCGKTGGAEDWEYSCSLLADASTRDGTFLDVGCANGEALLAFGFSIDGQTTRRHRGKPGMEYRALWIDAERG